MCVYTYVDIEADMWMNVAASSKFQLASNKSRACLRGEKELRDEMIALCNIGTLPSCSVSANHL